jgi:chromosome segregation ATPase
VEDAHARVRRLEEDNGRLRRELGQSEAHASIAETRIAQLLEELHGAIAEADALRWQVKQLQERVDHLLLDNDQYRRALVAKGGKESKADSGPSSFLADVRGSCIIDFNVQP